MGIPFTNKVNLIEKTSCTGYCLSKDDESHCISVNEGSYTAHLCKGTRLFLR